MLIRYGTDYYLDRSTQLKQYTQLKLRNSGEVSFILYFHKIFKLNHEWSGGEGAKEIKKFTFNEMFLWKLKYF